ncbi:MAG: L-fuculose-phosphate aldolase [Eubacteriales bacterium]|nr:L-fuculose-phosphate aldolase [Eubacteriales bacterium]
MKDNLELLVQYGNELFTSGLTSGTGGNLSYFDREKGLMYITPSGIPFADIKVEDMVALNLDGEIVEGFRKPSSEWALHLIFYKNRNDINAVIHAHTTYSTVFAVLNQSIPPSHYMLTLAGKDVRCAEYAPFGTKELAKNAFEAMKDRKAALLANHGIITGGASLAEAFAVLRETDYCAKIHILAKSIGEPIIMPDDEMERMSVRFKTYGQ